MAVEEGWRRRFPHKQAGRQDIERMLGCSVLDAHLLGGGLRNTNYHVTLEQDQAVLRLYTADGAACRREISLLRLAAERVPVPAVLRADPDTSPPWALLAWLDGIRFDQMLVQATTAEVQQACRSAGEILAAIHSFSFPGPGLLGPNLEIAEPMGYPWLTGVAEFFGAAGRCQTGGSGGAAGSPRSMATD